MKTLNVLLWYFAGVAVIIGTAALLETFVSWKFIILNVALLPNFAVFLIRLNSKSREQRERLHS